MGVILTPDWELKPEIFFRSKNDPKFGVKVTPHKRGYPVPNKLPQIYCVSCCEISVFPPVCMKYGPGH